MKKLILLFVILALIAATVLVACFFLFREKEPTSLEDLTGQTLPLSKATPFVCELAEADLSDDFSAAFMQKATIHVLSIDEERGIATVEFTAPDVKQILLGALPADTSSGDYEALFTQYCENITAALANATPEQMITQSAECPVVVQDTEKRISIEGVPLFNYQEVLADALLEMLFGSEE